MNPWILLVIAGLCEVGWSVGLKFTEGFSKPLPTILTLVSLAVSMALLAKSLEHLPLGIAYSIWVGIGALGATLLGIFLFGEGASLSKFFFLTLLIVSLVGLKWSASSQ